MNEVHQIINYLLIAVIIPLIYKVWASDRANAQTYATKQELKELKAEFENNFKDDIKDLKKEIARLETKIDELFKILMERR